MFPRAYLDELRSRIRLSDWIGREVRLQRRGREHVGLCPFHSEKTPSFTVRDDRCFFHCFGCGAHGDVIEFVRRHDNLDFAQAVATLAGELAVGIPAADSGPGPGPLDRQEDEEDRRRRRAHARRLWDRGRDPRGTLVEKYLRGRGLHLLSAPALRFARYCWNRETNRELPAMLARVDGPDGAFVAVHRTWLRPDGHKADLVEPKMSLAPTRRGAVRLAAAGLEMAVGEGLETCLAFQQVTETATWCGLSGGGLRAIVLPPLPLAATVHVLVDLDEAGERAAQIAADRFFREGRLVELERPIAGKDCNDALREMRAGMAAHAQ
jgi:DNA primase